VPITIEEFTKLPERSFPPLVEYVQKRFGSKQGFVSFLFKKTGVKLQDKPYDSLMNKIFEKVGKQKLLSVLGIKDEREAELRAYLFDALYKGLTEAAWSRHLSPLYERITGKKVKMIRKIDKKVPAHVLAFAIEEKAFTKAWIALYKQGILPAVFHYGKLTVGAFGWLKANNDRWEGYFSTMFEIISEKFTEKSRNIIYGYLFNILEQVAKNPEKFEFSTELSTQLVENLKVIAAEKDDSLRSMMTFQLIETYMDDEDLCDFVNQLIAQGHIEQLEVQRFYERFPYSFSDWIITSYGVFKQPPSWLREPSKELANLVEKEFDQKYLEPDLEQYHGSYPLKVLEYCIIENPENIVRKFGVIRLRKIAEELGIRAALKVRDEEELLRLVILKLGFNLPPILCGLMDFNVVLEKSIQRLTKSEPVSAVMVDVYGETERVLQDITYFYICFLWRIRTRSRKPEEVEADVTNVVRDLKVSDKPFSKLTFGELIKLVRTLNKELHRNKNLKNELFNTFGRKDILPQQQMEILNEMSKCRAPLFAHKRQKEVAKRPDRKTCSEMVQKLKEFSRFINENKIYPKVIRVTYEVTNEYGTRYFKAVDDEEGEWTIKHQWLDPSKPYFMYSKTNPVAVDPIIIEKIF
jgi:hypothetical protein